MHVNGCYKLDINTNFWKFLKTKLTIDKTLPAFEPATNDSSLDIILKDINSFSCQCSRNKDLTTIKLANLKNCRWLLITMNNKLDCSNSFQRPYF